MADEDENIVLARIAEKVERYDEMVNFMEARVQNHPVLSSEERDMLSSAAKNALTERRHALRVALSVAQAEKEQGRDENVNLALGYKSKVETELNAICQRVLKLLEQKLIPASNGDMDDTKTFYLKMKGDYYRYLAEFASGEAKENAAAAADQAYREGTAEAQSLPPEHPVSLGLALNFSVFLHEVRQDTGTAVETAKNALKKASTALNSGADGSTRSDAVLTMQLLQDNLSLWESC